MIRQGPSLSPALVLKPSYHKRCCITRFLRQNSDGFNKKATHLKFHLTTAVHNTPHPDKLHYGGEDAWFVSQLHGGAFGIADGVGGCVARDVNPAEYSRKIMESSQKFLERAGEFSSESACSKYQEDMKHEVQAALNAAHLTVALPGASTALVMNLEPNGGVLAAVNLGDSGFIVIRDGVIVHRCMRRQHFFDCPYQILHPSMSRVTDMVVDADVSTFNVQDGDVIVAATDGLWDNCHEHEVIALVQNVQSIGAKAAAEKLAMTAQQHMNDPAYMSPYIVDAKANGMDYSWWQKLKGSTFKDGRFQLKQLSGGKLDDITVIVALVASSPSEADTTRNLDQQ